MCETFVTVHAGGRYRYPSVWGDIHVDDPLDEISLVRLLKAIDALNFTPREVIAARIGPTLVTLDVLDFDTLTTRAFSVTV